MAIQGNGQLKQSIYLDAGSSTVSNGLFARPALTTSYGFNSFYGSTGFQWTFSSAERNALSGWFISGGSKFTVREIPLSVNLFYLINPYSKRIRESNPGGIIKYELNHLDIQFGYHIRRYRIKESAIEQGEPLSGPALSIWEYRNFLYRGTLHLKERDAPWNLSVTVTNFDYFLVQQETNPMLRLAGHFRISDAAKIHSALWYQGAGMSNIHANHYGFYFRTGIVWQVGS
jgi:hypothetical protein